MAARALALRSFAANMWSMSREIVLVILVERRAHPYTGALNRCDAIADGLDGCVPPK
jgi:hypothetical protein